MIKTIVVCDLCGEELPVIVKNTPFGPIEVYKRGKTKVFDMSSVEMCETCALKIDNALLALKLSVLGGKA